MQNNEMIFFNLMDTINKEEYEPLSYFLWENFPHKNCSAVYNEISDKLSLGSVKSKTEIANAQKENILRLINTSLYIIENIIPEINKPTYKKDKELKAALKKINTYKKKWAQSVDDYFKKNNAKKYILKEYLSKKPDLYLNEFKELRSLHIKDWIKNKKQYLSSFYYVDDLVKSQKNLIFQSELTYIVLNEIVKNKVDIEVNTSELQEDPSINIKETEAGQIPNWLLLDGLFRVSPIEVFKHENIIELEDGKTTLVFDKNIKNNLSITVPNQSQNEFLNTNFDSSKDPISLGRFELAVLIGVLQIGRDQLKSSNKIAFSFNQLLNLWNSSNSGKLYNKIKKALFYLSMNMYTVQLANNITRNFYIINAIEKPTFNSSGEQEWIVEIDSRLREQILEKNYTELYSEEISSLKYELSPILYKTFVIDLVEIMSNNKKKKKNVSSIEKEYTLRELSTRSFLEGKPNIRKKKLKNSLDDIMEKKDSILQSYEIKENGNVYKMYFNQFPLRKEIDSK